MLSIFAIGRRLLPSMFATHSWISPLGSVRQYAMRPERDSSIGGRDADADGEASAPSRSSSRPPVASAPASTASETTSTSAALIAYGASCLRTSP